MTDAISIVRAGLTTDLERLRTISQNVSNLSTVGYKAETVLAPAFDQVLDAVASERLDLATFHAQDRRPGPLKFSVSGSDLALVGQGFFQVQTADGVRYTRRGDFRLDETGRLVDQAGHEVLGQSGSISLQNSSFTVDTQGRILDGSQAVAQLAIVQFDADSQLTYEGNGLYSATDVPASSLPSTFAVRQGYLEASNVDVMRETVSMIEVTRQFAMVQRAMQGYDDMLDVAINRLGQA